MAQDIPDNSKTSDNLFVTNLGNSQAGTIWEIRIAKRQHWTLGLRAASLAIYSTQSALSAHQSGERTVKRKGAIAAADLKSLTKLRWAWHWLPFIGVRLQNRIEQIQDEIQNQVHALPKIQLLVRDCEMELAAAIAERDLILKEHPEALTLSYLELQTKYSREALMGKISHFMAARVWAASNNLPESVGQLVFDGSETDRLELLVKELELRHEALPVFQTAEIVRKLAAIPLSQLSELAINLGIFPSLDTEGESESLLLRVGRKILTFPPAHQASLFTYLDNIQGEVCGSDRILDSRHAG